MVLGMVAHGEGDYSAAHALLMEGLLIYRELGDQDGIATSLNRLAFVHLDQGDYPAAQGLLKEALRSQQEHGVRAVADSLEGYAAVAFASVRAGPAARIWGSAERLREELGSPMMPVDRPWYDRHVASARAALGDDAAFDLAWQEGRAMTLEQAMQYALDTDDAAPGSQADADRPAY